MAALTATAPTIVGAAGSTSPTTAAPAVAEPETTTSGPIPECVRPDADNTGPRTDPPAARLGDVVLGDDETLSAARVDSLSIEGNRVTVSDVVVDSTILVTGDDATIEYVATTGIAISSASGATVRFSDIGGGDADGIHVTSDRGELVPRSTSKQPTVGRRTSSSPTTG